MTLSICVTTCNRHKSLEKTIHSIIKQKYQDIEIIIVNDCPCIKTDSIVYNIIKKYKDKIYIRYIPHKTNKGLATARNTAIKNSAGKYFTFIDDDDVYDSDGLNTIMEFIDRQSSKNDSVYIGGNRIGNIPLLPNYMLSIKDAVVQGYTPPVGAQIYPIELLRSVNGYNDNVTSGVDHDLWMRLIKLNPNIISVPVIVTIPNRSDNNRMTTNTDKRVYGIIKSLNIWKEMLIDEYGKEVYDKIYDAYIMYLLIKLVIKNKSISNMYIIKYVKNKRNILKYIYMYTKHNINIQYSKIIYNKIIVTPTLQI